MLLKYFRESSDYRKRLFTTLVILAVYRLGAYIPAPGIDQQALQEALQNQGGLLGFINLLSGGTLAQFCILGLGILPFINARQILNLLVPLIPGLERRVREDPREGRRFLDRLTLYLTVPLATFFSYALIRYLSFNCVAGLEAGTTPGFLSGGWTQTLLVLIVMTAGAMFSIFLAQQIDHSGVARQGVNLLIFSGIPAILIGQIAKIAGEPSPWFQLAIYALFLVGGTFCTLYIVGARRNIPVVYPGRRISNRMSMPIKTAIPLPLPLTFDAAEQAQGCLIFPGIVAGFLVCSSMPRVQSAAQSVVAFFQEQSSWFPVLLFILAVAFTFFLSSVRMAEARYGESLMRAGAMIPGVHPGEATQKYLEHKASIIALPAALYLGILLTLPWLITLVSGREVPLIAGSTIYFLCVVIKDVFFSMETDAKLKGYDAPLLIR